MVAFLEIVSADALAPLIRDDDGIVLAVDPLRCEVLLPESNAVLLRVAEAANEAFGTPRGLPLCGPIEDDPEWEDDDAEDDDDDDDEDDDFFPDDEDDDFDDDEEDDDFDEFEDEDDDF